MFYNKNVLGGFVRNLDANGCLSPETAKTINELGVSRRNFFVRISLKHGYTLKNTVRQAVDILLPKVLRCNIRVAVLYTSGKT